MTMSRLWTPNRPSFAMAPYGALVAACRPKGQAPAAFSPLDIAGLQLWLRADAGLYQDAAMTTPAVTDADPVGGWADQSLNNNHATQATAGSRPILKLAIQNGKPVVRFDGANDALISALNLNAAPFTVMCIAQRTGGVANWQGMVNPGLSAIKARAGTSANWSTWMGVEIASSYSILNLFRTVSLVVRAVNDLDLVTNGIVETSAIGLAIDQKTDTAIGATDSLLAEPMTGDIAEILIYNSAISTADRQAVEAYLNSRWGVY